MEFDTGNPQLGMVEVDEVYTTKTGCIVGKKDSRTDRAATYLKWPNGQTAVVRTVGVTDRSPQAAERIREQIQSICERIF